ncbi:hypothetical protein ACFQ60_36155 [Streptomyces zhihengii]
MGPLALVSAVFIAMAVPRYLTLDPADSKIPRRPDTRGTTRCWWRTSCSARSPW